MATRAELRRGALFLEALEEYALWCIRHTLCKCSEVPCFHGDARAEARKEVLKQFDDINEKEARSESNACVCGYSLGEHTIMTLECPRRHTYFTAVGL